VVGRLDLDATRVVPSVGPFSRAGGVLVRPGDRGVDTGNSACRAPHAVLPVAQRAGLMPTLDRWVLDDPTRCCHAPGCRHSPHRNGPAAVV
jgi:hypothetical protein